MQFELLSIQRKLNKTIIFITHDINEAFKLGDRVAIMRDGKVIQIDTPENMITNPADDYVREFIEGADKSKVMSVRQVMITPSCIVKTSDGANRAIVEMRSNNVSSAYIVNEKMEFKGMLTLDGAIKARDTKGKISDYFSDDVITIEADATIGDAMPLAANAKYPIAVLHNKQLKGIITKASLISTLADN
jgi:glycine betaine/proline transport system ATP-binding protein